MLVDVIILRRDGRKRPIWEIQAEADAPPLRGDLSMERFGTRGSTARLKGQNGDVTAPIRNARIELVRDDSLLVTGVQETQEPGKMSLVQRQSWWCRIPIWRLRQLPPASEGGFPGLADLTQDE